MALLKEFKQLIGDLAGGTYPDFITKNWIGADLPVFIYHRIEKSRFKNQLEYLKVNTYRTLDTNQLREVIDSGKSFDNKSVVLTFDDGLEDLYTVAYPLLQLYGYKGIVFIAPFWIGAKGMINWEQIKEMHKSGVIDFQSHSLTHGRIPISDKVIDFFHPKYHYYKLWQLPFENAGDSMTDDTLPPFGTPLYQNLSVLDNNKKYLRDTLLDKKCIELVYQNGGQNFFKMPGWRLKLRETVKKFHQSGSYTPRFETGKEQEKRIKREINRSRSIIEKQLPDKEVLSFSYPYNERGELTDYTLRESGYRIVFGGIRKDSIFGSMDGEFTFLRRVSGDFVTRLPGRGREPLLRIMAFKCWRRLRSGPTY